MPIDNRTPKSCTIGTFEILTVRKAMTAAIVAATSGGPMWTSVRLEWTAGRFDAAFFLDAVLDLDRELDAETDEDRQPGDRDE